jgi:hypothetical protein
MYNGEMLFADRETRSLWAVSAGMAMDGPLSGRRLSVISLIQTTWSEWRAMHPDTKVLSADTPYKDNYKALPPRRTALSAGLQRTMTNVDPRLPAMEQILAVEAGGKHRAYPLAALEAAGGVVNDSLGDVALVVLMDRKSKTAAAFARSVDGKTLEFAYAAERQAVARDKETGSLWRIDGRAVSGRLNGRSLDPLNFHVGAWYSWSAYFPGTTIYGQ